VPPHTPQPIPCSQISLASSDRTNVFSIRATTPLSIRFHEVRVRAKKAITGLVDGARCPTRIVGEGRGEKLARDARRDARMCEMKNVIPLKKTEKANHASHDGLDQSVFSVAMSTV